jgi:protocatechuate 3,4-dioxygenase beta subunit
MKLWVALLSCVALCAAVDGQTPPQKTSENCTIQGQIVQQPGAVPIRKVQIGLSSTGDDATDESGYKTVTDADGRFRIENIKPGNYRLSFGHAGFVDAEKRHHGSGMLLSLTPGQEVKDLLLHVAPAAVITAKVLDGDGDPLARVEVLAIAYGGRSHGTARNRASNNVGGCSSDDLGECRISDLPAGKYLIAAQPRFGFPEPLRLNNEGKDASVYTTTYYPGTADKGIAVPIELHPGDEAPVKIALATTRTFHMHGRVTGLPTWAGSEGAQVFLQPQNDENDFDIKTAKLDKSGAFDIEGVLPGSYSIFVVPSVARSFLELQDPSGPQVMRMDQTVTVDTTDVDDLRLMPIANGLIRGRFRTETGQKIDWSQLTALFYTEEAVQSTGSFAFGNPAKVKRDGSFETLAFSGTYRVWVTSSSKALQDYFVKAVNLGGKDVSDPGFRVGGASGSLEIVLSANGATIEGIVAGEKDQAVSDVHVVCIPDANRRKRRDLYQDVRTDAKGRFKLRGLNPGEYTVFAVDDDVDGIEEMMDPEFIRKHEGSGKTLKVEEGDRKSVVLKLDVAND